ncbi:hypothetical protein BLNAU_925 [Blattamonas nauphoetae]|uniref:Uncharacterized protein n=1 Tax=Blattamonas nauphoetae TaxID=2049346 RepID=A0ABQ9YKW4_9EUKA|nr:hypothetical protein BLNAU_925 [Blattamonas nauphoetae]
MPKTNELLNRHQKKKKYDQLKREMNRTQAVLRLIKDGLEYIFDESSPPQKNQIRRVYALVEDIFVGEFGVKLNSSPSMHRIAKDYAEAGIWRQTRFFPPEPDTSRTP